jgi:hypothetical protein
MGRLRSQNRRSSKGALLGGEAEERDGIRVRVRVRVRVRSKNRATIESSGHGFSLSLSLFSSLLSLKHTKSSGHYFSQ